MAKLNRVWHRFTMKYNLYKSLMIPILLYRCETWTMLAHAERRIQPFKNVPRKAALYLILRTQKPVTLYEVSPNSIAYNIGIAKS